MPEIPACIRKIRAKYPSFPESPDSEAIEYRTTAKPAMDADIAIKTLSASTVKIILNKNPPESGGTAWVGLAAPNV